MGIHLLKMVIILLSSCRKHLEQCLDYSRHLCPPSLKLRRGICLFGWVSGCFGRFCILSTKSHDYPGLPSLASCQLLFSKPPTTSGMWNPTVPPSLRLISLPSLERCYRALPPGTTRRRPAPRRDLLYFLRRIYRGPQITSLLAYKCRLKCARSSALFETYGQQALALMF